MQYRVTYAMDKDTIVTTEMTSEATDLIGVTDEA